MQLVELQRLAHAQVLDAAQHLEDQTRRKVVWSLYDREQLTEHVSGCHACLDDRVCAREEEEGTSTLYYRVCGVTTCAREEEEDLR